MVLRASKSCFCFQKQRTIKKQKTPKRNKQEMFGLHSGLVVVVVSDKIVVDSNNDGVIALDLRKNVKL